jgi:hypothetical protein
MISARCRRHRPGNPLTECRSHQRSDSLVHSDARYQSPILRQAKIVAQYTVPVVESSVAPVIASAVA